ncbi:ATPase [Marinobacter psychrophilus]|jgi:flagellar biosynthesis protein FlhG|uniref:ATPase n=1 Tax=Marinobacter psychrophilus TaxID=330734 RepID=A0A0H4I0P8_9GAMM|nr:AAA family ATPase [Marinobacter psychrophilus]AKO52514.1 ATPase [Marinobacter psychrophilus]
MTDSRHVSTQPRVIAVTGGKGGVGKTSVAINLALALTREGHRVLLLDGDLDLANVAIMLGQYPRHTLEHVLRRECTLDEIIMEAPLGLHVIPGASGVQRCMDLGVAGSLDLLKSLAALERRYDYVLIDTAAGLQPVVLHMIASAAMACVVVTPDPASLTDAFSLIKVLQRQGYRRTPSVLVNMAHGASQAQSIFQRFAAASQSHLNVQPHYLGAIWRDETLRRSVITQRPVALLAQSDPSCQQFHSLADRVKIRLEQLPPRKSGIAAYWYKAVRRSEQDRPTATPSSEPTPPKADLGTRVRQAVVEFDDLVSDPSLPPILRNEALSACFALLGRTMDDDTIEIIQTGLAALDWEALSITQRAHLATYLRDIASQVAPGSSRPGSVPSVTRGYDREPRYDQVIFGDQECLLKALREQPRNISLDHFLRGLAGKTDNQFEG